MLAFPNPHFVPRDLSIAAAAARGRSTASPFDHAQLEAPLAIDQGESSWYCFEGWGRSERGRRHLGGLVWLHRTGPRMSRLALGPSLVSRDALPARWRELVPSWLPIIAPVDLGLDDRPLFLVVLYDLDAPAARPLHVELPVDHALFDPATFSAATAGRELELHQYAPAGLLPPGLAAFFAGDDHATSLQARCDAFELQLHLRGRKPMVGFGEGGSPRLRHGQIEIGYAQRSLEVVGAISLGGEVIHDFTGEGAHDRHWREATIIGLRWAWLHLRLAGDRELVAYVLRDTRGGATANADDGRELGRRAWLVDAEARVHPIGQFELWATAHEDTARGRVPTRFGLDVPSLALRLELAHATPLPFVPMRAFGDVAELGFYEAPVVTSSEACKGGWLEVVTAPG